jgi:hypothetical protein
VSCLRRLQAPATAPDSPSPHLGMSKRRKTTSLKNYCKKQGVLPRQCRDSSPASTVEAESSPDARLLGAEAKKILTKDARSKEYQNRGHAYEEDWKNSQDGLFNSGVVAHAPIGNCHCGKPNTCRCQQCGPGEFFCKSCCEKHHAIHGKLHVWEYFDRATGCYVPRDFKGRIHISRYLDCNCKAQLQHVDLVDTNGEIFRRDQQVTHMQGDVLLQFFTTLRYVITLFFSFLVDVRRYSYLHADI